MCAVLALAYINLTSCYAFKSLVEQCQTTYGLAANLTNIATGKVPKCCCNIHGKTLERNLRMLYSCHF